MKSILIEFNELCPALLDKFMTEGLLPHFKRLYEESHVYTTDASLDLPNLNPWVQWVTVHTGAGYDRHHVARLGESVQGNYETVGSLLSKAGVRVGICASMNLDVQLQQGYVLPDPWSNLSKPYPAELNDFSAFVSNQVKGYSKGAIQDKQAIWSFLRFMLLNGVSLPTYWDMAKQLVRDSVSPEQSWRRAATLDLIQYDIFRHLNKKHAVEFATFFANSTAHYQHYYWRNMAPEQFDIPPGEDESPSLSEAVLYGYQRMDRLIGKMLQDYPEATLILCSALSQQPWRSTQKVTYKPKAFELLFEWLGIADKVVSVQPVMAEEFRLTFRSQEDKAMAKANLLQAQVAGQPLMKVSEKGELSLFCGCAIEQAEFDGMLLRGGESEDEVTSRYLFSEFFYLLHSPRSGKHHPDGVLWVRTGEHRKVMDKVPLTVIAPTLLKMFHADLPGYMNGQTLDLPAFES